MSGPIIAVAAVENLVTKIIDSIVQLEKSKNEEETKRYIAELAKDVEIFREKAKVRCVEIQAQVEVFKKYADVVLKSRLDFSERMQTVGLALLNEGYVSQAEFFFKAIVDSHFNEKDLIPLKLNKTNLPMLED